MNDLSRLVYKASKGELRVDALTDDATALGAFELSPEERLAVQKKAETSQWLDFAPNAIGGWY